MNNAELVAEARRWAKSETYEETTAVVIRKLAHALEESEAKLDHIQSLVPVGIAEHDRMYDALMAINRVFWPHA